MKQEVVKEITLQAKEIVAGRRVGDKRKGVSWVNVGRMVQERKYLRRN